MNPAEIESMLGFVRANPDRARVRVRINNGEWEWMLGREFLELWGQPFAGTIDVDNAILPREDAGA